MTRLLLTFVFLLCSQPVLAKQPISMLFVNPSLPGEPFWQRVEAITRAAATELGVELEVIYGEGNRIIQLQQLEKYLAYRATPDYVLLINYPSGAEQTLTLLDKYKVKHITLERTLSGPELQAVGKPKQRFPYWLGEIHHNNEQAGFDLAKALYQQAKNKGHNQIYPILINGHYGAESELRQAGAERFFKQQNIAIQQVVYAGWSKKQAMDKATKLLKRYPDTNLIWSASDLMAMGAIAAPNLREQVVVGGFDWLSDSFALIHRGKLNASVGGHFMMGAWALISAYDHFHGHPFWSEHDEIAFDLSVVTKDNITQYQWIADEVTWQRLDYTSMSLVTQPQQTYQFSLAWLAANSIPSVKAGQ